MTADDVGTIADRLPEALADCEAELVRKGVVA